MIEKVKKVSNPLTIVAFFCGLSEISATVCIGLIEKDIQEIFIWFLIFFPVLLLLLFFLTLNFNSKVLYAPGDYVNEDNYMKVMKTDDAIKDDVNNVKLKLDSLMLDLSSDNNISVALKGMKDLSSDLERIKEQTEVIPISDAWNLNHWGNNYAKIEDGKLVFTSSKGQSIEDGCNIDLIDTLTKGKHYTIKCHAKSSPDNTGKIRLWCHDKSGQPNGVSRATTFIDPTSEGDTLIINFPAENNHNIRIHIQYLPGEGKITVNEIRIKEIE